MFQGESGLRDLEDEWTSLAHSTGATELMQFPGYYLSFAVELCGNPTDLSFAAFYREGQLRGVLPLALRSRKRRGLVLNTLGFPATPIPIRGWILSQDCSLNDVLACLKQPSFEKQFGRWDVCKFDGIPGDAIARELSHQVANPFHLRVIGRNNSIGVTTGAYARSELSGNMRSNLNRAGKRLAKSGQVEYETIHEFPALEDAYQAFLVTEASGWKSQRGGKRAVLLHEDQQRFYHHLMESYARRGGCHIHLLRLDGEVIAADYCIVEENRVYSLKHGYDERYSHAKPGHLLREYTLEYYMVQDSIQEVDLISGYDWQNVWKPRSREVVSLVAYNNTAVGWLSRFYGAFSAWRAGA